MAGTTDSDAGPDETDGENTGPVDRGRLAQAVFPDGEEPDPRFTLANERTFLAWTRTSLAFLAGGIALDAVPIAHVSEALRTTLGVFVIVVGLCISAGAAIRWIRVERAMRRGRALPVPAIVPLLSAAAVAACIAALVVAIV